MLEPEDVDETAGESTSILSDSAIFAEIGFFRNAQAHYCILTRLQSSQAFKMSAFLSIASRASWFSLDRFIFLTIM